MPELETSLELTMRLLSAKRQRRRIREDSLNASVMFATCSTHELIAVTTLAPSTRETSCFMDSAAVKALSSQTEAELPLIIETYILGAIKKPMCSAASFCSEST